jgi:hypothetical protein
MKFDAGTTDIPTATTQVQISNTADRVKSISVRGRPGNAGNVFFGVSDVETTDGWTLQPGESKTVDFGEGSVLFSVFYVNAATNGDDVDWTVILE